jgi:signal recognition particle receptor subunit beta
MLKIRTMPVVSPLARELVFKIVYYGPGLGGKTTSLQHIHATAKPEHRGKMVSLATPVDRTLYFDFLPIRLPNVRGMSVRLQLFTVPGQVYYNATRKLVLTGVDGVVLVFDSQRARVDANLESLENLVDNLTAHGKSLGDVPHVIEYNKRDLYDVLSIEELDRQLNRWHAPSFATTATSGEGVYEALEAITRAALEEFQRRAPETRGADATTLELPEGGLVEALRRAEADSTFLGGPSELPAAIRVEPKPEPRLSGSIRLSQLPEADVGEAAARVAAGDSAPPSAFAPPPSALAAPPSAKLEPPVPHTPSSLAPRTVVAGHSPPAPAAHGLSFEALWPNPAERALVRELEEALAAGDFARSLGVADRLVARTLASAGALLGGTTDAPRDPATVLLLLGLDGQRYLQLRTLVRDVRAGRAPGLLDALGAYATAIELRLLRAKIGA